MVGGGLAGAAAALSLAQQGAAVTLLRAGPGATALCAGTLDVAGASPLPGGLPFLDPIRGVPLPPSARLSLLLQPPSSHPYAAFLGAGARGGAAREEIESAARWLSEALEPEGLAVAGGLDAGLLVADVRGALRVADFAWTGCAEGDVATASEIALVGIPGHGGGGARAAALRLADELAALGQPRRPIRLWPLELPDRLAEPRFHAARLAARIDDDAGFAALLAALGRTPHAANPRALVLFPPMLGLARTRERLAALRDALGCRVAELAAQPPEALAGYRLDRALLAALARRGVAVHAARARQIEVESGKALAVVAEPSAPGGEPLRLAASAIVLATGRFVGGGLEEHGGRVREALLDLPLFDSSGRRADGVPARRQLRRRYEDPQPLFTAGVRADAQLRPLHWTGRPVLENLFVAGELLGGFDPARERSGLGLALASGLAAARSAQAGGAQAAPHRRSEARA